MCNNQNWDLVNMNAYVKFGEILSICSKILSGNEILTSIKGLLCYKLAKNYA